MPVPAGTADEFAEFALTLHDLPTVVETVDAVLEYAVKAVGADHAGVIFVDRKVAVETVAATNEVVAALDQVQSKLGEGPDIDVVGDRFSVRVDDTRTDARWPRWCEQADRSGLRSMIGVRLYTSADTIGSLNLYSEKPHAFDSEDQEVAHILARHAAVAIAATRDSENLWKAIDARKLIGQAQGILMERFGIDDEQAFAVLRRYSQDNNVKLHTVARRLLETRRMPD